MKEVFMAKIQLTKEGYESLKEELADLKEKLMNEVAKKIKEAREFGDLSENSEYDEAKKRARKDKQ
jgi:transcription elongation factor GreA